MCVDVCLNSLTRADNPSGHTINKNKDMLRRTPCGRPNLFPGTRASSNELQGIDCKLRTRASDQHKAVNIVGSSYLVLNGGARCPSTLKEWDIIKFPGTVSLREVRQFTPTSRAATPSRAPREIDNKWPTISKVTDAYRHAVFIHVQGADDVSGGHGRQLGDGNLVE